MITKNSTKIMLNKNIVKNIHIVNYKKNYTLLITLIKIIEKRSETRKI